MQNSFFSLKYKVLLLLVGVPCLGISIYFLTVKNLFQEDKRAYIFDYIYTESEGIKKQYSSFFKEKSNFIDYISVGWNPAFQKLDAQFLELFRRNKSVFDLQVYSILNQKIELKYRVNKNKKESFSKLVPNKEKSGLQLDLRSLSENKIFLYKLVESKSIYIELGIGLDEFLKLLPAKSSFNNYIFSKDGIKFQNIGETDIIHDISKYAVEQNLKPGVFEFENELFAFKDIGGIRTFSVINKDSAYKAMELLNKKSVLFIILVLSSSLFISIIATNLLTKNINKLHAAAESLSEGNFDIQINVKSNDEMGKFARTFVQMAGRIKKLLSELEEYNRTLEQKVKERTAELREAMNLQKTILDSVDQGFVLINKDMKVSSVYSKASVDIFSQKPSDMKLGELLHLEPHEHASIEDFFTMAFQGMMPFKDIISMAPQSFQNKDQKQIFLEYIKSDSDSASVVVVATDKSDEINALKKAEEEKDSVQLILKAMRNRDLFIKFFSYLKTSKQTIEEYIENDVKDFGKLFMDVHTLKGNAGIYNVHAVVETSHILEDQALKQDEITKAEFKLSLTNLNMALEESISHIQEMLGEFLESNESSISEYELNKLISYIGEEKPKQYLEFLIHTAPADKLLSFINEIAGQTAENLNKEIKVETSGADLRVNKDLLETLEMSAVHIVNNCIDHGIAEKGVVSINISETDGKSIIEIKDDGNGIDTQKLVEKAQKLGLDISHYREEDHINLIFEDGFSTKEEVSEVSGRGIGMAQVRSAILKIGGNISVKTVLGKGTTFTISSDIISAENKKAS